MEGSARALGRAFIFVNTETVRPVAVLLLRSMANSNEQYLPVVWIGLHLRPFGVAIVHRCVKICSYRVVRKQLYYSENL